VTLFAVRLSSILCKSSTSERQHAKGAYEVLWMPLLVQSVDHTSRDGLATSSTQGASLLVVVGLAVRFAAVLVKGSSAEGLLAVLANKVLGVPLVSQSIDALALDGLIAPCTPGAECVVEAVLAVRAPFLLKECTAREWSQALAADEVVRMPLAIECSDAFPSDWLVTVGTTRAEEFLVASLAVWDPVLLVEVACAKGYLAVATHEVLGVVGPVECLDDLTKDGFATVSTIATRCRSTIESTSRGSVDVPEHVVQIRTIQHTTRRFKPIASG